MIYRGLELDRFQREAIEALEVLTQDNIRDILREQDPGGRG